MNSSDTEPAADTMPVDYPFFRSFPNLMLLTFFGFLVYYLVGFGLGAGTFETESLTAPELAGYLLVDQYLIECISMGVLFGAVLLYARLFRMDRISMSAGGLTLYFLRFLPLTVILFFAINPVSQTLRFLWRFAGDYDWSLYWEAYFYSPQLYLTYTGILLPLTYLGLGVNLILQLRNRPGERSQEPEWKNLRIMAEGYENYLSSRDALWFEVEGRTYYVVTGGGRYRLGQTLKELEEMLDDRHFYRLNRSVIVNLEHVDRFSHWKNGRYILIMDDPDRTEHTIPRSRVKGFKKRMATRPRVRGERE